MTQSLRAHRTGVPARYAITGDDQAAVATITAHTLQRGGDVDVDGHRYILDVASFGRKYRMRSADGREVAAADRAGPRSWTLETGGRSLRLTRGAFGRNQVLVDGEDRIGAIHRVARGAQADLPGLDRPAQVFALVVALSIRQRRRRAVVLAR